MATKKSKRAMEKKARKKKKGIRIFFLSTLFIIGIASLAFLFFTLSDFIGSPDSEKVQSKRVKQSVQLYFSDSNERFLVPERRLIPKPQSIDLQAEEIVKALIEGPKTDLVRTFPEDTKLLSIRIEQGTAIVDFDSNLIRLHPGGSASELATIYSLTNSLTGNLSAIHSVKILIDGKTRDSLKGHMDTSRALKPNKELIRTS
jgi:hypothetical protein